MQGVVARKTQRLILPEALYTDDVAKTKIAQVKISLSPQIQVGLGAKDAGSIDDETWKLNGFTNFSKSLALAGKEDDVSKDVNSRTYFKSINSDCSE